MRPNHPTKQILIDTTVGLLDELPMERVTSDLVLETSRISKGSLYHHFPDYGHLIDEAQVVRFARYVDESMAVIAEILQNAVSLEVARANFYQLTQVTQSQLRSADRKNRVQLLGLATQRPNLQSLLGREQHRLTTGLADLIREAQERGWVRTEYDPAAISLMIQSYTLGLWLAEMTPEGVSNAGWVHLINALTDQIFLVPPAS